MSFGIDSLLPALLSTTEPFIILTNVLLFPLASYKQFIAQIFSQSTLLHYSLFFKHVFQLFNRFVRFSNRRSEQQHIAFTQEKLLHGFQSITKLLCPFQGIVLFDLQRQLRILASSYCKLLFPDSRLFYSLPNCRDEL